MIILNILGGLLLLLLILLSFPVTLEGSFGEEISLQLQYLFLKLKLLPSEKKAEEPQKQTVKKTKAKSSDEEPKQKKTMTLDGILAILELVKEALSSLGSPLGWFLRKIRYRDLWLHLMICQSDAHQTALRYGQCQALVHSVFAVLRNTVDVTVKDVQINADFIGEEERFAGGGKVKLRPINALIFVLWFGGRFGITYLKDRSRDKKLKQELKAQCSNNTTERKD